VKRGKRGENYTRLNKIKGWKVMRKNETEI
jgi:hypothetical protein